MNIPNKIELCNKPTRIEKLEETSKKYNKNIFLKREDETGTETSGNKIRKLEFCLKEALEQGATHILTCGGLESNHARSTVAACRKIGFNPLLFFRAGEIPSPSGNHFLDNVFGAEINYIDVDTFNSGIDEIMKEKVASLFEKGIKGYIVPMGASYGIGNFGYYDVMKEIMDQEKTSNITFDTIVTTLGSGGTYAGLMMANKIHSFNKTIVGIPICDTKEIFEEKVLNILEESNGYLENPMNYSRSDLKITRDFAGLGYALNTEEELQFIKDFARGEGVLLDPTYTGKAFRGMTKLFEENFFENSKNILFIHTGGVYGLFSKQTQTQISKLK
jgi:D-cysteine desulfhydrase